MMPLPEVTDVCIKSALLLPNPKHSGEKTDIIYTRNCTLRTAAAATAAAAAMWLTD